MLMTGPDHASSGPDAAGNRRRSATDAGGARNADVAVDRGSGLLGAGRALRGRAHAVTAMLLDLQRSAGNTAVRGLLVQRDGDVTEWAGGPVPSGMIEVDGACEPTFSGGVEAKPEGGMVGVTGPVANVPVVNVNVASGYAIADGKVVHVGYVQNVTGATRIGVYRAEPQSPEGSAQEFEQRYTVTGARYDVAMGRYGENEPAFKLAQPPFYLPNATLSTSQTGDSPPNTVPGEGAFDRPHFALLPKIGAARLVAVKGQDTFVTSIAAKDGAGPPTQVTHLTTAGWRIGWDIGTIDDSLIGSGGSAEAGPTDQAPTALEGPTARESFVDHLSLPSVEAAMGVDARSLFDNLAKCRQAEDWVSYSNSALALRRKNPVFTARLECTDTHSWVLRDKVRFWLAGTTHDVTRDCTEGEPIELSFALGEIDVPAIEDVEARLNVLVEDRFPEIVNWNVPFESLSSTLSLGDGAYRLTASIA